jgi:hypothetical protein
MPISVVLLEDKDLAIMKALAPLRALEAKLDPLLDIHDILQTAIQIIVFDGKQEDDRYEIKLDENHTVIFEIKDGKFSIDQTCTCEHEEENEDSPQSGGLTELLIKAMMKQ